MKRRVAKLVLTIDGKRLVFAAMVPRGKTPDEMTLGEWMAAPALSAAALCEDFFHRASKEGDHG
jgi:hypothetical protein